ncbi:hypothetical protein Aperf_G00000043810 [Anoplocephala perfoliata]
MDAHRLTLLHFSVCGLAVLNEISSTDIEDLVDFIYAHQICPCKEFGTSRCGFRGSSFIGTPLNLCDEEISKYLTLPYDSCHVTTDYSALISLLVLGDNLERVNRQALVDGIKSLQNINGNLINGSLFCPEFDPRFIYSAIASAYVVDMLDELDLDGFEKFMLSCKTYEGAFGSWPKLEAHAGLTYCVLASLKLMGRLDKVFPMGSFERQKLTNWLLSRQNGGFNGRCHKNADTCYAFWVGACLKMLDAHEYVNRDSLLKFIISTFDPHVGGFMKSSDGDSVDQLHSYMALAGLSCLFKDLTTTNPCENTPSLPVESMERLNLSEASSGELIAMLDQLIASDLQPVVPELNIPLFAFHHLKEIHAKWRSQAKDVPCVTLCPYKKISVHGLSDASTTLECRLYQLNLD